MRAAPPVPGEAVFSLTTLTNTESFRGIIGFSRLNSEAHRHPMFIVRGEGIRLNCHCHCRLLLDDAEARRLGLPSHQYRLEVQAVKLARQLHGILLGRWSLS